MRLAVIVLSLLLMFAMAFVAAFRRTIWALGLAGWSSSSVLPGRLAAPDPPRSTSES